jgi:hypothetical protein
LRRLTSRDYRLFDVAHAVLPTRMPLDKFYGALVKTQEILDRKHLGRGAIQKYGFPAVRSLMRGQTNYVAGRGKTQSRRALRPHARQAPEARREGHRRRLRKASMLMAVMDVGKVRVTMPQSGVHVPVRVRLPRWLGAIMAVLVMLVMHVPMLVGHLLVPMLVLVALRQMKPNAEGHEGTGRNDLDRHRVPQNEHCDQPPEERSQREVGPGPSGTDVSKGNDEEHQADTVAGKSYNYRGTQHPGWREC